MLSNTIAKNFICFAFIILLFSFNASAVWSQENVSVAHTRLDLVPSVESVHSGQPFWMGVRMVMEEGWHVYWRNSGDSGFPVKITWDLPEGYQAGEMYWPVPERLREADMVTYGYTSEVIFLSQIFPSSGEPSSPSFSIKARVDFLACKLICVPGTVNLEQAFPLNPEQGILSEGEIDRILQMVPIRDTFWMVEAIQEPYALRITGRIDPVMASLPKNVHFFPFEPGIIDHVAVQNFSTTSQGFDLIVPFSNLFDDELTEISGVLVADQPWREDILNVGWEVNIPVSTSSGLDAGLPTGESSMSIWGAIVFAFLGGLILNLMPCVLPVLSIKVLNLVQQAGESRMKILWHGLAFAFGVIAAFWVLAGLLLIFRLAGVQVGWGFQFQSPLFLVFMIFLFLSITLNLFGAFEIGVGLTQISSRGNSAAGSLKGSFLNGVLATIVATPCTAPFMGAALGFALVQPFVVAWLIFTALGLGMALPYLIFSLNPSWLKQIPRPGLWMVTLKQSFGFVLLGTICWLIWVVGIQLGTDGVMVVLLGMVLFSFGLWVWGRAGGMDPAKTGVIKILAVLIILAVLGYVVSTIGRMSSLSQGEEIPGKKWIAYSPEVVENYRARNIPVFVDFTASWCLTCQVNKSTTLYHPDVESAFEQKGVILVKADWTNYDPVITQALGILGKSSIPVYVLYPPGGKEPLILPELLTPRMVYQFLEKF